MLHGLTRLEGMSRETARLTVLFLAIFPTGFFFLAPYTRSQMAETRPTVRTPFFEFQARNRRATWRLTLAYALVVGGCGFLSAVGFAANVFLALFALVLEHRRRFGAGTAGSDDPVERLGTDYFGVRWDGSSSASARRSSRCSPPRRWRPAPAPVREPPRRPPLAEPPLPRRRHGRRADAEPDQPLCAARGPELSGRQSLTPRRSSRTWVTAEKSSGPRPRRWPSR